MREEAADAFGEFLQWRDQAHYQVTVRGEIVEMAGVDEDTSAIEQVDGEILVRARGGHAKDGVPTAFDCQAIALGRASELAVEFGEVLAHAYHELRLKSVTKLEECGGGGLNRRIHG